ncbi:ASCH domain-containing protein [Actinomycetes bacterium NPDC127524]
MTNENMQQTLPPKTCSIERLVTVKKDIEKVIAGEKTAARRNGRYADVGEVMVLDGKDFTVEKVYQQTLGEMTEEHAVSEGYENLESYKEFILSMHKGMKWLPQMKVWVHEFRQA